MIETFEVSDLLLKLVDRSLVTFDSASGRFRLLETVRQYAAELESHTAEVAERRDRHLDYFIQFCGENAGKIRSRDQAEWLPRFDADFDNIRIAMEWGLSSGDSWLGALELLSNSSVYWIVRARFVEAAQWFDQLKQTDAGGDERAQAVLSLMQSFLAFHQGGPAVEWARRAWELSRKTEDRRLRARALGMYVVYSFSAGQLEEAFEHVDEALELLYEFKDNATLAFIHINFGNAFFLRGELARAEEAFLKCLEVRQQSGDLRGVGSVNGALGYVYEDQGDLEKALECYRTMMRIFMETRGPWDLGGGLPAFALTLMVKGRNDEAARLLGSADRILRDVNASRDKADTQMYERRRAELLGTLGEQSFTRSYEIGHQSDFGKLLEESFPDGF